MSIMCQLTTTKNKNKKIIAKQHSQHSHFWSVVTLGGKMYANILYYNKYLNNIPPLGHTLSLSEFVFIFFNNPLYKKIYVYTNKGSDFYR